MPEGSKTPSKEPVSRDTLTELLRTGARQLLAHALEAERAELLAQYADQQDEQGRAMVVGSGHHPEREIQTGLGPVSVQVPKVRSRQGPPVTFHSALVPPYVRKSATLEAAIPWLYLKGISTGEMQTALEALVGPEAKGLSASTVARLKQTWRTEYQTWRQQRLDEETWVYVWVDGIYSGLRADEQRLCALVVIGVTSQGKKQLLAIEDGVRESTQSWREVLLQLKARGMKAPTVAIGDGALGFWGALEEVYPTTQPQRCWVHKTRNVLNALPKSVQPKAKQALHEIWQAETKADANRAFGVFLTTYEAKYPKATACLEKDREALLTFYAFPAAHWQSLRTTNPIESTFGTIRHRTKRTKSCLTRDGTLHMMFKLGRCAEQTWRRLRGFRQLALVIKGVQFTDGIEVTMNEPVAA
ncbi:MAG: IS256 family transposase [Nitrospirales bacterium]|nr:IS256 family transposase [Nitrospirales bacterium]MDR4484881.1 IS256 family transposase [Nitrospirales bacterium]